MAENKNYNTKANGGGYELKLQLHSRNPYKNITNKTREVSASLTTFPDKNSLLILQNNYDWYVDNEKDWEYEWDNYNFLTNFYDLFDDEEFNFVVHQYDSDDIELDDGRIIPHPKGKLSLYSNTQTILVYSNDFEYIILNGLDNLSQARVYDYDQFEYIIINNVQDYIIETTEDRHNPTIFNTIEAKVEPALFKYFIHLELSEESYIPELIRGGSTGFAEGLYLKSKTLFGNREIVFDVLNHKDRIYEFCFRCYGVSPEATSQILNIEYMTAVGIGSISIDITDQLVGQPKGGVIICKNVTLPNLEDPNQVFTISFETDNPNYEVQLVSGLRLYQSNKLEFQVNYGDSFYNAIGAESGIQIAVVPKVSSQLIGDEEGNDGAKEWKCFDKDGNELLWGDYEQTSLGLSQLLSDRTIHIYKDHRFVAYCV